MRRLALVKRQQVDYRRTMDADVNIAPVATLMGDVARARMLTMLMDGRAWTAKELAYGAGVTPQTASSHLAKLLQARLLVMERQSRHRYYRLASTSVSHAVEALMAVSPRQPADSAPEASLDRLRLARTCYDHFAGRLGIKVTDAMVRRRLVRSSGRDFLLTAAGARLLERLGVDVPRARQNRRAFARQCLDWSERRPHLAGALGAALADRCFALHWVQRAREGRSITITPQGVRGFRRWLGISWKA